MRGRAAVGASAALALVGAGCDASSHDESLAGYALLFGMMFVAAAAVGLVLATVGLVAGWAGTMTLGLNVICPSGWSRAAGVVLGYVNVGVGVVGAALLALLTTSHRAPRGILQLHAPSLQSLVVVIAFVALGIANVVAAIDPRVLGARRAAGTGRR